MNTPLRHIGIVTLYHPDPDEFVRNCERYVPYMDRLVVWNNSAPNAGVVPCLRERLAAYEDRIEWVDCGENRYIQPAITHTLSRAVELGIELMLVMDQDSYWTDFPAYMADVDALYKEQSDIAGWAPYVYGCNDRRDGRTYELTNLINSGSFFRVSALNSIGGADPLFPLDGLDNDMAFRLRKAGHRLVCLPQHELKHNLGHPIRSRILHIYSTNYNAERTYSITRSQLLVIRRHHDIMTRHEIWIIIKEYILWKFIRICLVETDKWNRFRAYCRGIHDALHTPVR